MLAAAFEARCPAVGQAIAIRSPSRPSMAVAVGGRPSLTDTLVLGPGVRTNFSSSFANIIALMLSLRLGGGQVVVSPESPIELLDECIAAQDSILYDLRLSSMPRLPLKPNGPPPPRTHRPARTGLHSPAPCAHRALQHRCAACYGGGALCDEGGAQARRTVGGCGRLSTRLNRTMTARRETARRTMQKTGVRGHATPFK